VLSDSHCAHKLGSDVGEARLNPAQTDSVLVFLEIFFQPIISLLLALTQNKNTETTETSKQLKLTCLSCPCSTGHQVSKQTQAMP